MKEEHLHCDFIFGNDPEQRLGNKTRLCKHDGRFRWSGVKREEYKSSGNDWAGIVRQTLIGNSGESARFHLRYFEIEPGGRSSFEMHRHEHVVVVIRGKGICVAGKKKLRMKFLDTLYIEPEMPHQLQNPYDEPFGFFCIVNARRDKPKLLSQRD
ncbi:MAG TPA: cupin domain-containing protein [Thermodesulfovibrionales bacterium]|nr:cupin domain-containing protein [Thermodesulfovibrionales bacterium]